MSLAAALVCAWAALSVCLADLAWCARRSTPARPSSKPGARTAAKRSSTGTRRAAGGSAAALPFAHAAAAELAEESDARGPRRRPLSVVPAVDLLAAGNGGLARYRGPEFVERHASVRRGESFARLLRLYDVSPKQAAAFERAARAVFDLARIRPRRSLTLFFDRSSDELAVVEYSIDKTNVLVVERGPDGALEARLARTPSSIEIRGVSGTVGESVRIDCAEAGVPERLVGEMADIFAWDVDLAALQPGDRFRVVYEAAVGEDGEVVQTGSILAAEVEARGRRLTAIYFADEDGAGVYYDAEGRSLDRGQLRFPLEPARVSSEFSQSRLHPILGRPRPHHGVDFAAPTGTPVRAISDGVVAAAGWQDDLGLAVRISHAGVLAHDSLYGHLSRISRHATAGGAVRKGEIIGYVGQTGCATGPHLHFALLAGDEYVDPMKASPPARSEARAPLGLGFARSRDLLLGTLAGLGSDGPVRLTRILRPNPPAETVAE